MRGPPMRGAELVVGVAIYAIVHVTAVACSARHRPFPPPSAAPDSGAAPWLAADLGRLERDIGAADPCEPALEGPVCSSYHEKNGGPWPLAEVPIACDAGRPAGDCVPFSFDPGTYPEGWAWCCVVDDAGAVR